MKVRIHGDSVRLRLNQAEVRRLADGQGLSETTHFGAASSLVTSVEVSPNAAALTASFDGGRLKIVIPVAHVRTWSESDQVAIQATQQAGDGLTLKLSVEKDFRCLHSDSEDNADAFPNPRQG